MVWGAISKSWKSPLIFVKEGVKVNTDSYVNDILTPALASMKEKFKNKSFSFQQDGAPSHTSKKTQKWCEDVVRRALFFILDQRFVATIFARSQSYGFLCVGYSGKRSLFFTP